MSENGFSVRIADTDDIPLLSMHRKKLWEEVHTNSEQSVIASALPRFSNWATQEMSKGSLVAFIAESGDRPVASACVWFKPTEPKISIARWEEAYLTVMYTEKEFRRMGAARAVLSQALRHCASLGIERMTLHTSEQGKELYRSFGFEETTEMRLAIPKELTLQGEEEFKP